MSAEPRAIAPCACTDPDVERLRELIAGGMGQREASGVPWGAQEASGGDLSAEQGATVRNCPVDPHGRPCGGGKHYCCQIGGAG